MFPLFESVCIVNGKIQHGAWHQRRYEAACRAFYQQAPAAPLFEGIAIPEECYRGKYKLKIQYNKSHRRWQFDPYLVKRIGSLQMVTDDSIDYALKYTNRSRLDELFQQRGDCDDVLIVKNGRITDSSHCNIVLFDGRSWYTPDTPLLRGTARERLLHAKRIKAAPVMIDNIHQYKGFKLINAMRELDEVPMESMENIFPLQ
ncbi:MAG: aminotransferase class IV [Bacteroidota bacterium]|nr:aminotransferase class IV [Bacteroidota bacterium]